MNCLFKNEILFKNSAVSFKIFELKSEIIRLFGSWIRVRIRYNFKITASVYYLAVFQIVVTCIFHLNFMINNLSHAYKLIAHSLIAHWMSDLRGKLMPITIIIIII